MWDASAPPAAPRRYEQAGGGSGVVTPVPALHQVTTPGYAAALISSPVLLGQLCDQYFKRYDRDRSGALEFNEVLAITRDLEEMLALPHCSEEELLVSLRECGSSARGRLGYGEFSQWFPRALGLTAFLREENIPPRLPPRNEQIPGISSKTRIEDEDEEEDEARQADQGSRALRAFSPAQQSRLGVDAMGNPVPPSPDGAATITPGYATALMASPNLLVTLCRQYFNKYDSNGNGFLEYGDVLQLAQDLIGLMAVPFMPEGDHLRPSIVAFSAGGSDSLSREEFCRWFPTVLGLDPPSPSPEEAATDAGSTATSPPYGGDMGMQSASADAATNH